MSLKTSSLFIIMIIVPFNIAKVPWSNYFCEVPDWYCDSSSFVTGFVDNYADDLIYRYCAEGKWCFFNVNWEEILINPLEVDLVSIDFAKYIPRCHIKNLPNLKTIYGRNKDITVVEPWSFWNLPNLEVINLSYNYITTIEYGIFNKLPSIKSLDLSWNEIEYIGRGSFQGMINLMSLDLSRNYISRFDATYYFYLRKNDTTLPLKVLNLSHNKLKLVDGLNIFLQLNTIDLSHNEIAYLNSTTNFCQSQWLKKLDLSDNILYKFDINWPDMYIDKLRIPFNDMIFPDAIDLVGRVNVVVLDGNLWECENYIPLLEKLYKINTRILTYDDDENIYFVTKSERENYPVCWVSKGFEYAYRQILRLETKYKTEKNPRCRFRTDCPKNMFCKSGRCWNACSQNVCDETATCVSDYHGFFCECPKGKIQNPYSMDTRCYNVQCFADTDCRQYGHKCNKKHVCEKI